MGCIVLFLLFVCVILLCLCSKNHSDTKLKNELQETAKQLNELLKKNK